LEKTLHVSYLVAGLGTSQLLAWGTLYYAIAVIAAPLSVELQLTQAQVFGAFTWALALSGGLAPWAGKLLDRHGGRRVLVGSTVLGAAGFSIIGHANSFAVFLLGWSLNGVAMALGLYEACFATLAQVVPKQYSRAVTGVTLVAGFSSSVTWPASHYLQDALGWRGLCNIYVAMLCLCGLAYALMLPAKLGQRRAMGELTCVPAPPNVRRMARLLAIMFAGLALISASLSAHMLMVLRETGISEDATVWVASSIGVMQVLGRLLNVVLGAKADAVRLGLVTFVGFLSATLLLLASFHFAWFVIPFAVIYGVANGLVTIAKATLPVHLFGVTDVGQVLGTFSRPSLVTRAFAPLVFAVVSHSLGIIAATYALAFVGALGLLAYVTMTNTR
jgi:MFS family permease